MKVMVFSHESDIDGMGGVILAKLAFKEVDYVLADNSNLQDKVKEYYYSEKLLDYNLIFITDMALDEPMLSVLASDPRLDGKVLVFDHHATSLEKGLDQFNFVTIKVEDDLGKCCGTSLFYEYLVSHNYLQSNRCMDEFVELTRQNDTWEWKTVYNNEKAYDLMVLFDVIGKENYIKAMVKKLSEDDSFRFTEFECMLRDQRNKQMKDLMKAYLKNMEVREINGLKAGIVLIPYMYRNDFPEYVKKRKMGIDFCVLICLDKGTVSFRKVNYKVSVREIAEIYGGGGHSGAAGFAISRETKNEIIDLLLRKKDEVN